MQLTIKIAHFEIKYEEICIISGTDYENGQVSLIFNEITVQ